MSFGGGVFGIGQVLLGYACEPVINFLPLLPLYNYYSICATSGMGATPHNIFTLVR